MQALDTAFVKRRTFEVEQRQRLSRLVGDALQEPVGASSKRIESGAVFVDGRRARNDVDVSPGSVVSVVLEAQGASSAEPKAPPPVIEVLFESADVVAVNKPAGLPAQPTPDGAANLLDVVSAQLKLSAGLVHRLDKETSGVTVFGKTSEATSRLAAAFREGRAKKEYLAIVSTRLPERGVIDTPLQKDPSRPGRWRAIDTGNGISALTRYEVTGDGPLWLVRLFPETGRTHQLRAHLTSLGAPIVGDSLYGGANGPRCLLHARTLELDGETFEAPVPADFPTLG